MKNGVAGTISRDAELVFSSYATSELSGGVILGRLALLTRDDHLRAALFEQASEETKHGFLFSKLVLDLGGTLLRVDATYQDHVIKALGRRSTSFVDLLWLSKYVEEDLLRHYVRHAALPGLDPRMAATFVTVLADETDHVDWMAAELERQKTATSPEFVEASRIRTRIATDQVFKDLESSPAGQAYLRLERGEEDQH